jgi:hypothetical protein
MPTPKKPDWITLSENDKPSRDRHRIRILPALVLLLAISGAFVSVLSTEFGDESNTNVAVENIAVDENVALPEPVHAGVAKSDSNPQVGSLTQILAKPEKTGFPTTYNDEDDDEDNDEDDDEDNDEDD